LCEVGGCEGPHQGFDDYRWSFGVGPKLVEELLFLMEKTPLRL
jgi:hypothetical protein